MTTNRFSILGRRDFLTLAAATALKAEDPVMRPAISETACPLERTTPIAHVGHFGLAFVRKPPGKGRFPAAVIIHGGLITQPEEQLREYALNAPLPCRFLAEGYVIAALTYRNRDHDPQAKVSLEDCIAVVNHLKRLPHVDPKSVVVYGCSGGGDLALEVAAAIEVCAIVPEEPASMLLAGLLNTSSPKKGERYTPGDTAPISANPTRYYTDEFQKLTRAKLARIQCPILIIQGDVFHVNRFNQEVLIPELRAAGKNLEVLTYSGESHCFCFYGQAPQTSRPAIALKAFTDIHSFCRRHVPTKPKALDSIVVKLVPVKTA